MTTMHFSIIGKLHTNKQLSPCMWNYGYHGSWLWDRWISQLLWASGSFRSSSSCGKPTLHCSTTNQWSSSCGNPTHSSCSDPSSPLPLGRLPVGMRCLKWWTLMTVWCIIQPTLTIKSLTKKRQWRHLYCYKRFLFEINACLLNFRFIEKSWQFSFASQK